MANSIRAKLVEFYQFFLSLVLKTTDKRFANKRALLKAPGIFTGAPVLCFSKSLRVSLVYLKMSNLSNKQSISSFSIEVLHFPTFSAQQKFL